MLVSITSVTPVDSYSRVASPEIEQAALRTNAQFNRIREECRRHLDEMKETNSRLKTLSESFKVPRWMFNG